MSDALPNPEILSALRLIAANTDHLLDGQHRIEGRLTGVEKDVATLKTGVATLKTDVASFKAYVVTLAADLATLTAEVGSLKAGGDQTKLELRRLRVDVMDRLDRFQTMLENVRDSTAVTLMLDQRVAKKLKETDQDRDDLFEQMMAMERQLMTLALRIDAIEDRSHP